MKRFCTLLSATICVMSIYAETFDYRFNATPLSEALSIIAEEHPSLNINFIYNELNNYKTSAHITDSDPYEALRRTVGLNPVSIIHKGNRFYIEALQHGRFCYTGRVADLKGEPVAAASVMLLAPKDSTVITYGITDDAGRFSIPCDRKSVLAKVACLGYKPAFRNCNDFAVGTITMTELPVTLQTVSVEADNEMIYPDKTTYIPTPRQRKAAQNGIDLLRIMGMSQVNVNPADNSVTNNLGDNIDLYINFMPASREELSGLRIADVKKVEYLQFPTDPRFGHKKYVINFIVAGYEYGGYTKLSAADKFLAGLDNDVSLYSKLSYKRMTYDLSATSSNSNNHHAGVSTIGNYYLPGNDGSINRITRSEVIESAAEKSNKYPLTFRAVYNAPNIQISNTLQYTYDEQPSDNFTGHVMYCNDKNSDTEPNRFEDNNRSCKKTIGWTGLFNFSFPGNYSVNIGAQTTYSRIRNLSSYHLGAATDFNTVNNAVEDAYLMRGDITATKQFTASNTASICVMGGKYVNNIRYWGDQSYNLDFSMPYAIVDAIYSYTAQRLRMTAAGGMAWERIIVDGNNRNDIYPYGLLQLSYAVNSRNNISFLAQLANSTPNQAVRGSNQVRVNELMYHKGNPELKGNPFIDGNLSYSWTPGNRFSASFFCRYWERFNTFVPYYTYNSDKTAIVKTYINSGNFIRVQVGANMTLKLLDGSLQLQVKPMLVFYRSTGYYDQHKTPFRFNASATYYLGNLFFQGHYELGNRFILENSMAGTYIKERDYYHISMGWSNANLNVRLSAIDFLRSDWVKSRREISSPVFTETAEILGRSSHRRINLSVTYTFGYGKKVQRGNEVSEQRGAASAILK
ncbi:MAG: TonB-dependent receptor family protein [Muribaculaceae bacterium]|nr:TonB-dependent receptor family protein [Muribaculaceae bacterium]